MRIDQSNQPLPRDHPIHLDQQQLFAGLLALTDGRVLSTHAICASRHIRRRARGVRPALRAESRPSGFEPLRLRPLRACALRLLSVPIREVEWRSCCFPSPYHGVLAVKGCARRACLRRAGCRPLTAALRRAGRESGNFARVTGARSCRSFLSLLTLPC